MTPPDQDLVSIVAGIVFGLALGFAAARLVFVRADHAARRRSAPRTFASPDVVRAAAAAEPARRPS